MYPWVKDKVNSILDFNLCRFKKFICDGTRVMQSQI